MKYQESYNRVVQVLPMLAEVEDKETAGMIAEAWIRSEAYGKWERMEDGCYSPNVPGKKLVDHVNVVTESSQAIAKSIVAHHGYQIDTQKLLVLTLMHDVCKLIEYEPDGKGGGQLSKYGKALPHGVISALLAYQLGFDLEMVHLIITHSSHIKNKPQLLEGVIMGFADLCDTQVHFWETGLPLITEL